MPVPVLLVQHGVFPTSPTRPQTGVSIELLDIYRALFERSCDAIMALAAALRTIYKRRGFRILSKQIPGALATDPFREGLGNAVLWFSNLQDRIKARLEAALAAADTYLSPPTPSPPSSTPPPPAPPPPPTCFTCLTPGRADRVLRERCPACFGLKEWGRSLSDPSGGDIQFSADGCFSYRHVRSAGDGPISYDPQYFISKDKVNKVRERIAQARKKPPARFKPPIPQAAVDACSQSWDAANENKKKADPKQYDSTGIFALTCRHSQVLFLCDIDTPGERQEYIVACLEEVNSLLPSQATILEAYDVGCVADNSFNMFSILSEGLRPHVGFVINAMHAYGHQWICQLVYSPRLRRGAGLSDHEGVERIWSRIRRLIPLTRHQWKSRRIWTLDQYMAFVNDEGRDGLGAWIERQRKNLTKKQSGALKVLRECRIPESELRLQWQAQKAAQTSVRSYAPTRLRHELEKIIALQTQIDAVEKSIAEAKASITSAGASTHSITLLKGLEATHETLSSQADALYSSLNIHSTFPELKDLPLEFVTTLVLMDNLKKNIRQRAVGSFLEWESLRCAVKGHREAPGNYVNLFAFRLSSDSRLGTKMYQATSKAIAKRQPALLRSVAKFNRYCAVLEDLRPATCDIPIPPPLATDLTGLRNDPYLQQDVWMAPSDGAPPRWLSDENVRDGIRSLHVVDRCAEEAVRLNAERQNLRSWLDEELNIVAHAMLGGDMAGDDLVASEELDPGVDSEDELLFVEEAIRNMSCDAEDDTSAITNQPVPYEIRWDCPVSSDPTGNTSLWTDLCWQDNVRIDHSLLQDLKARNQFFEPIDRTSTFAHIVVGTEGRLKQTIEDADLARLRNPTGLLNNFCINGLAAALLEFCTHNTNLTAAGVARWCVVLTTHELPRVRYKCGDAELWRSVASMKYWEKAVWIVPVHRLSEKHWVLIIVMPHEESMYFFDSMNGENWRPDLRLMMVLITRMVILANRNGHPLHVSTGDTAWIARPLRSLAHPSLQTNVHDCGLWVLCTMAAVMRGHALAAVTVG
ncbi:hypothetical protein DFH07DRAFT_762398 [Mycena maculata]|uniref:Ubiquitin-like protease family profile domain-containing protein n=1 Tax=Mycena maculata TaxID=230809 RepID=A0AAD7HBC9_9AGAR|nr:hypothetical protein DFH07DRAFT_762398 [Mycena maculata]